MARNRRENHTARRANQHPRRRVGGGLRCKPVYTVVTANAKPAVLLNVYRQPDSNTVTVADEVHKQIEDIRRTLPKGIELSAVLRPVRSRQRFDQECSRCGADRV